jgi:flagellar biosynthesis protein FlhF
MKIRTFKAATMHEALLMVREELGPDASLLDTRQVRRRWLGLFPGRPQIEVTASREISVPSRLPKRTVAPRPALPPSRRFGEQSDAVYNKNG